MPKRRPNILARGTYWRIASFPELEHLSDEQRRQLLNSAKPRRLMVGLILRSVAMSLLVLIAYFLAFRKWQGSLVPILGWAATIIAAVLLFQIQIRLIRASLRRTIANEFAGEQLPACLQCGFDLRNSDTETCPECNAKVQGDYDV